MGVGHGAENLTLLKTHSVVTETGARDHWFTGGAGISESMRTRIIGNSESQKEADVARMGALSTKTKTRIGFWDVITIFSLFSTGKLAQLTREMEENYSQN